MVDKTKGLIKKYIVERCDGSSKPGGKHYGCAYFVLDLNHDPFARAAVRAYAEACKDEYPLLSADLLEGVDREDLFNYEAGSPAGTPSEIDFEATEEEE